MYIVVDSTVLTADRHFSHSLWKLIGSRPERWGLKVAVPWTVVQEASANRRRDLRKILGGLTAALNGAAEYGVRRPASEAAQVEDLRDAIDGAEEWIEHQLAALRIEVLPADFDHRETVSRSVNRRRPCDSNGNGYRDTLNWMTVLRLVRENPEEKVIGVSKDSDFFEEKNPGQLHRDLIEDLDDLDAAGRVVACLDAEGARELLIKAHQLQADTGEWPALALRVAELVAAALNAERRILNPVECGLPLNSRTAHALLESATAAGPAAGSDLEATSAGPAVHGPVERTMPHDPVLAGRR